MCSQFCSVYAQSVCSQPDLNDCVPNSCQNGAKCVDGVNNYTCTCDAGWTGQYCDQGQFSRCIRTLVVVREFNQSLINHHVYFQFSSHQYQSFSTIQVTSQFFTYQSWFPKYHPVSIMKSATIDTDLTKYTYCHFEYYTQNGCPLKSKFSYSLISLTLHCEYSFYVLHKKLHNMKNIKLISKP